MSERECGPGEGDGGPHVNLRPHSHHMHTLWRKRRQPASREHCDVVPAHDVEMAGHTGYLGFLYTLNHPQQTRGVFTTEHAQLVVVGVTLDDVATRCKCNTSGGGHAAVAHAADKHTGERPF